MATALIPPPPDAKIPPPPDALPTSGSAAPLDLIGQIKARLIKERPPGEKSLFGEPTWPGSLVRGMVPGSWPSLVATALSLASGKPGIGSSLARTGAAGGLGAGIEAIRGGDPLAGALEAGGGTLAGEAVGGVGRAGTRYLLSKVDPLATKVAEVVGSLVPAFRGSTPRSTLAKAMGTEGQMALSKQYGDAVDTAITAAGNPILTVGPFSGKADEVWRLLKSEKRRLMTTAYEPARTSGVFQHLDEVHAAEDLFASQIEQRLGGPASQAMATQAVRSPAARAPMTGPMANWYKEHPGALQPEMGTPTPTNPDAAGLFARANDVYRRGKEIQRLFAGGPDKMTPAKIKAMLKPGEALALDQPTLATNLMARSGKLKEALGPEGYAALEAAIQRGGALGTRDILGKAPHMSLHLGLIPSLYGLPHAPRLVGKPEQQSKIVADILRRLGVVEAGSAMTPGLSQGGTP